MPAVASVRNWSIYNAADNGMPNFSCGSKHRDVGVGSGSQNAFTVFNSQHSRGIQGCQSNRILKVEVAEPHDILNRAIHGQHASRQLAMRLATALPHFHLVRSEMISAVRHASSADRVGDEHGTSQSLCAQKKIDHFGPHVLAIGDNVGGQMVVGQDRTQQSRIAMIHAAHCIERMGGVPRAGVDSGNSLLDARVGVPDADADAANRGLRNQLQCAFELGGKGQYGDAPARGIPHAIEHLHGDGLQVKRRMHAAAGVAEERSFEMDSQRARTIALFAAGLHSA